MPHRWGPVSQAQHLEPQLPKKERLCQIIHGWLVVLTILNMKVNGKDNPIYSGKKMFETTNQWFMT